MFIVRFVGLRLFCGCVAFAVSLLVFDLVCAVRLCLLLVDCARWGFCV